MKKLIKYSLVVLCVGAILLIVLIGGFQYKTRYAKTEIETYQSVNGNYSLVIYEIGEPEWPFGSTYCRFVLYNATKEINKCNFSIQNDGASAHTSNFDVSWHDDKVMIIVNGEEQNDIRYDLYYDGLIENFSINKGLLGEEICNNIIVF